MQCIPIYGLNFDQESVNAIKDIKRRNELFLVLSRVMPFRTMANIFLGNGALQSAYNISQTDFETLAKAIAALPALQRKIIHDIAAMQFLTHSGRESKFWKGVADGCGLN